MDIFVFGCGGHAKVVSDVIEAAGGWRIAGYVAGAASGGGFLGHEVFAEREFIERHGGAPVVLAVGDNALRRRLHCACKGRFELPAVVHPGAIVSPSSRLGDGTVVMAGAIVNAAAEVGRCCVVNSGAVIEHDCRVGDFASVAPRACLCGSCSLGEGCSLGAGATVIQGLRLGSWSVVGAGAVVCRDVDDETLVVGAPARPVRRLAVEEQAP